MAFINWLLAFLSGVKICFSKEKLLSISTPSNFTQFSELIAELTQSSVLLVTLKRVRDMITYS